MEQLKSYLTKEGWSRDCKKTAERHPKLTNAAKKIASFAVDIIYSISTPISTQMIIADQWNQGAQYHMEAAGFKRPGEFVRYLQHEAIKRDVREELGYEPILEDRL